MHPESRAQLGALAAIVRALGASRIPFWLFGGWAVDFAVGRVTREHADIDLVVFADQLPDVVHLLEDLGYEASPTRHLHQTSLRRSEVEVQLNVVERRSDGAIVSPGTFSDWPWHPRSFGDCVGRIGDIEVPVVSVEAQLEAKEGFPRHRAGSPHRLKDVADISVLRQLLDTAT